MSRRGRWRRSGRGAERRTVSPPPAPPIPPVSTPTGAIDERGPASASAGPPPPSSSSAVPVAGPSKAPTPSEVAEELATVDAAHTELILRRAIELSDQSVVVAERFPVTGLEEVAAELQMPAGAVAEALAEYRAGGLSVSPGGRTASMIDRVVGPKQITVRSRTGLDEAEVRERLSQWLKRRHRLRIRINPEGTVVAIRRRGLLPGAMRQVRGATGSAGLSGLREVRGAAVAVEDGPTMICVVADLGEQRAQSVVAGTAIALGGAAVVSTAAAITAPVTLVGVPVAVGAGWFVTRFTHRRQVRRVQEEVEMTTDNVAAGARPLNRVQEMAERLTPRSKP